MKYSELAGLDDTPGEIEDFLSDLVGAVAPAAGGALGTLIAPGAGTALGTMAGGMVGDALTKDGKKGKGATVPAIIAGSGLNPQQLSVIVRELLATVPPPVKEQVLAVIRAVQLERGSVKEAEKALVSNIEAKFMPAIKQAMDALKLAHRQRTATSEHRGIMKDARRWKDTREAQRKILKRITMLADQQAAIQSVVNEKLGAATVLPKGKVTYLGGKRLVDILASKR